MKRFRITNPQGFIFEVVGNELGAHQAHWGKPEWTETIIIPAVFDDEGNEVSPESVELVEHPAEYSIEEQDISAEIEAKKAKALRRSELAKKKNRSLQEINELLDMMLGE